MASRSQAHKSDDIRAARQGLIALVAIVAACAALLIGTGVAFASCASSLLPKATKSGASNSGFAPAAQIPIPASACPYLRSVYGAASNATKPWEQVTGDTSSRTVWQQFAAGLAFTLPPLANALSNAIPHVPPPIADDFKQTRAQLEIGIAALRTAHSLDAYSAATRTAALDGIAHLSHAFNMAGTACGLTPGLLF